jgi:ribose 5-phosphate isomerase B
MRIGIAADHGGFGLKEDLRSRLTAAGHEVVGFGANRLESGDDYPDFVTPLARAVTSGKVERGVAVCGSGVRASVCANKVPGVRAALINDHFSARQGVEDVFRVTPKLRKSRLRLRWRPSVRGQQLCSDVSGGVRPG